MLAREIRGAGALLESVEAIRNWRAVLLLFATFAVAAILLVFAGTMGRVSLLFVPLIGLLAWLVAFYGGNAVGLMMMDEARGDASRPVGEAISTALSIAHRLILVFLLVFALYIVGMLALALVLFISRIPFIGPLLYVVVFPVAVVVTGVALFALPTVIFPLAAPAVWRGAGVMACFSQLLAIARKRLVLVVLLMIAVTLIAAAVSMLIMAILMSGTALTASMSAGILGGAGMGSGMGHGGFGGGPMGGLGGGMGGLMGGFGGSGGSGGHVLAATIGGGLLFAVAFSLPGMVYLRGACTVYLRAIDGLDLDAEQAAMDGRLAAARTRAREMQTQAQAKAQNMAQRARTAAPGAAAGTGAAATDTTEAATDTGAETLPPSAAAQPAARTCPACHAPVVAGDAFCGECGHKLA